MRVMTALCLTFALLLAGLAPALAEPLTIRIAWTTMPGHMIPVLFSRPEVLKHYGKTYTVEPIAFRGSSPQLAALAAGQIDFMTSSSGTLALAVENAHLDVKVVADVFQEGVPGHHSETFVVRADSPIRTVDDLRGRRIASNAIGSASDTAMRAVLDKHGISPRQFTTIQAAFPSMLALLDDGKVDAAPILMPQLIAVQNDPKYRVLFNDGDGLGHTDAIFLIATSDFLARNKAAVQDFTEDYVRAWTWFKAPANRAAGAAIVANFMKVPVAEVAYQFTADDYYRDPNQLPDLVALQNTIDILAHIHLLPKPITVAPDYADLSFIQEAVRRIAANP